MKSPSDEIKDIEKEHSLEDLQLLISYLSLIGIWIGIPSAGLLIQRDHRAKYVLLLLLIVFMILFIGYGLKWKALFPNTTQMILRKDENNK